MSEGLIALGFNNLLLSAAVGALAYGVHRRGRYPALAHLLWVLTLVAAVMPPLLVLSMPVPHLGGAAALGAPAGAASATAWSAGAWLTANIPILLIATWSLGSLVVFAVSAQRIVRFGRLLRRSCRPAPPGVQRIAKTVAYELDMSAVPSIHVSAARLAPMTWWSGGRVRVVLPEALRDQVDEQQLRWILAHELAHIKRRDHLVRWLEWLASVACWWNPVVWWARRSLRRDEEDACDALVLEHLQGRPRAYARTLLTVVEIMAAPSAAAPTLATGIDAARSLEHRFTRIVSPGRGHRAPRALVVATVAGAMLLMTVGVEARGTAATPVAEPVLATTIEPVEFAPAPSPAVVQGAPTVPRTPAAEAEAFGVVADTLLVSAEIGEDGSFIGTAGADVVTGTNADEAFKGHAGADTIGGGPGRDTIDGGAGADTIRGGDGADTLNGGRGRDTIGGGAGADVINGGAGADVIQGGAGRDTVAAGAGDDIVRVWADGAADVVDCGGGHDRAVIGSIDIATGCEDVVIRDPA